MTPTADKHEPATKAKITILSGRDVRIERILNAPRDRVWKAMTRTALVAEWWARGNKLGIERVEVRAGKH